MKYTKRSLFNGLLDQAKFKRFLAGFILAFLFIGILSLLVFFVQTRWFPVKNLKGYLTNTNYSQPDDTKLVHIKPKDKPVFFEFKIPESEKENRILLVDMTYNNVKISVNGEELLFQEANFNLNPKGILLNYKREELTFPISLSIVIHPGGFLEMEGYPLIAEKEHLMINAGLKNVFNSFMFFLVAGMGFLLAFILVSIGFKDSDRLKSFIPVGIAMLYYGAYSYFIIYSYGNYTYYIVDTDIWRNVVPNYLASTLLLAGLEYYFLKQWKMFKIVLVSDLILIPFLFVFPAISYLLIIAINFFFFSLLAYKSDMLLFNFMVYTRFVAEIYNFFSVSLFPYWQLDLSGITLFVMLFGVGYFFILDFNKQNELLKNQGNELQVTNEQMYAMNEVLKDEYMEIEKINNSLEEKIKERTSQLRQTMNSIKTLLNNTGEGFLKFNDSLLVEEEYSAECKKIFCKNIEHHFFPVLISKGDLDSMEMTTDILRKILHEENTIQRELLMSLLPSVIESCQKVLSLKYRLIEEEDDENQIQKKIMVIIKDITKELSLQNRLKEEKELFEEIIKLIAHYDDFHLLVEEYNHFWDKDCPEIIQRSDLSHEEKRNELFRRIHTFKGSFGIFGLKRICEGLHMLENQLEDKDQELKQLIEKIKVNRKYANWLEEDMSKVYEYIQPTVLEKQRTTSVERESIKEALDLLNHIEEKDALRKAKQVLQKGQLKPFDEVFETQKLLFEFDAQRSGVLIDEITVKGKNTLIDDVRLRPLFRSWVHIFRNIIDHGIESPEERAKTGKDIKGKINVEVHKDDRNLTFKIQDDGRGIDPDSISEKAVEKGLANTEKIKTKSDAQILNFIFEDGFSTKKTLSETSGRGVGLAAVKKEVEKLSGTIQVLSQKDVGTTFVLKIPRTVY